MPAKVVDASAVGAILFGEPGNEIVAETLAGSRLFAPTLLPLELANIYLKKIRRASERRASYRLGLDLFKDMSVELAEIDPLETIDLAEATGLTAYDASYLWLARRLEVELVTLDRRLAEAGARPRPT